MPFEPVSTPLNDLAGEEYLRMDGTPTGAFGGLYPQGSNSRQPAPIQPERAKVANLLSDFFQSDTVAI